MNDGERTGSRSDTSDPLLHDQDMLDEIDVLTELIVTATASYGPLTQQRIDEILGLHLSIRDSGPTVSGDRPSADVAEPRDQPGVGHEAH